MSVVTKRLGHGQLATSQIEMYFVPPDTTTIVKALTVCNRAATAVSLTLRFNETYIVMNHTIKPLDTVIIPCMDQVLHAGESITGSCSVSTNGLNYYISGKEVT